MFETRYEISNEYEYAIEKVNTIPENELQDYYINIKRLYIQPISTLSPETLKEMREYFKSKREMIENAIEKFYNTIEHIPYLDIDWDLISVIITYILKDSKNEEFKRFISPVYYDTLPPDTIFITYSNNETIYQYYRRIITLIEDAKDIKSSRKPATPKDESSPYAELEKYRKSNNECKDSFQQYKYDTGATIITTIILLIIILISSIVFSIINSEYLFIVLMALPAIISGVFLYYNYPKY
jgi:hypothetical protein